MEMDDCSCGSIHAAMDGANLERGHEVLEILAGLVNCFGCVSRVEPKLDKRSVGEFGKQIRGLLEIAAMSADLIRESRS